MNWLDALNDSLDYIENSLEGEIRIARAAAIAGTNAATYARLFQYIADVPLNEYIRRRRLSLAANDIAVGRERVADVALKYGYSSPTAFNRAFQAQHGVAPSRALGPGVTLKAYPRIYFHLQIKGETEMEYEIKTMPGFKIVGKRWPVFLADGQNLKQIPQLWADMPKEEYAALMELMDGKQPEGLLGACGEMFEGGFLYYIAVATDKPVPEGMYEMELPAATWAVFKSVGALPAALQSVIGKFYSEWLPASGYDMNHDCAELEVYGPGDNTAGDYTCWAWMPVVKK